MVITSLFTPFPIMDKQQTARWNRQLKIKQVRQDFAATPVSLLLKRKFARHDALLHTADDLMTTPAGRSEGATLQKSTEEKRVIAEVLPFANALHLLHLEGEEAEKAHALSRNKTDYTALPGPLLLAEARNVAKQAHANASLLASDADLDQTDLDTLDVAIAAYAKLMAAPKVAIETGKNTNTSLGEALRAADDFVKTELAPAAATIKRKHRQFYDALIQAMRIDDAPGARGTGPTPPTPPKPAA